MTLDEKDIKILLEFNKLEEDKEITSWKIMRKIYPSGREKENENLKYRMGKMAECGLFVVEGNPRQFVMIQENVVVRRFKFPDRSSKGIALKIDDKWEIFEL